MTYTDYQHQCLHEEIKEIRKELEALKKDTQLIKDRLLGEDSPELKKIKDYDKTQEGKFKVGDLVYTSIAKDGSYLDLGVIVSFGFMKDDKALNVISSSGNIYRLHNRENWHKTGDHFDLQGILDRIEEYAKKGKN